MLKSEPKKRYPPSLLMRFLLIISPTEPPIRWLAPFDQIALGRVIAHVEVCAAHSNTIAPNPPTRYSHGFAVIEWRDIRRPASQALWRRTPLPAPITTQLEFCDLLLLVAVARRIGRW